MTGDRYTILKGYKVFQGNAIGEPMEEMTEGKLEDWLRVRLNCDYERTTAIISKIDKDGFAEIALP